MTDDEGGFGGCAWEFRRDGMARMLMAAWMRLFADTGALDGRLNYIR